MTNATASSVSNIDDEEISHDPILQRLAKSDTFDSDWPTLRHHLHLALLSTLPIFQSQTQPTPYAFPPNTPVRPTNPTSTSPTPSPIGTKTSPVTSTLPPATSLLLSRSPSFTSSSSSSGTEEQPSTFGGLIIPPFPPLDPERRTQRRLSAGAIGPVPPAVAARVNGHAGGTVGAGGLMARGNVFEDEWDEAVVIGGKKLPGWLEEEEGKKEVERVGKILDDLSEPPFTIQRLAELLLNPTKHHKSLGKFLRALEKNLLVTTTWTAPTYVPVPPSTFSGSRGLYGPTSSPQLTASSPSSNNGSIDSNSTMPVGATTPMFSPIPFLVRPSSSDIMDIDIDREEGISSIRNHQEELMSPLILNDRPLEPDSSLPEEIEISSTEITPSPKSPPVKASGRSQTPEPEDISSRVQLPNSPSIPTPTPTPITAPVVAAAPILSGSESSDPGHQPYLGRVDELDTGPINIPSSIASSTSSSSSSSSDNDSRGDQGEGMGTGEGGNMTPHGMSEKPIPISATTTVVEEGERKLAGLPRSKSTISLVEPTNGMESEDVKAEEVVGSKVEERDEGLIEEKVENGKKEDVMVAEDDKMDVEMEVELDKVQRSQDVRNEEEREDKVEKEP